MAKVNRYNPKGFSSAMKVSTLPITSNSWRPQESLLQLDAKGLKPSKSFLANTGNDRGKPCKIPYGEIPRSEFINSERNQDKEFYTKDITDCYHETKQLIMLLNKGIKGETLQYAKVDYTAAIVKLNLCVSCHLPFKLKQTRCVDIRDITYNTKTKTIRRNKSFRVSCNSAYESITRKAREKGLLYNEIESEKIDKITGEKTSKRKGIFELALREKQIAYNAPIQPDNSYADIESHFEFVGVNGKAEYRYIDGTKRDIRLSRERKEIHLQKCSRCFKMRDLCGCGKRQSLQDVKKVYFESVFTCEGVKIYPAKTYRIQGEKCECWK